MGFRARPRIQPAVLMGTRPLSPVPTTSITVMKHPFTPDCLRGLAASAWVSSDVVSAFENILRARGRHKHLCVVFPSSAFTTANTRLTAQKGLLKFQTNDLMGHALRWNARSATWLCFPINNQQVGAHCRVVAAGTHWTLAVMDLRRHVVYHLDSMHGPTTRHCPDSVFHILRAFGDQLLQPQRWSRGTSADLLQTLPAWSGTTLWKQSNGVDCGMFVLGMIESIARGPHGYSFSQDDIPDMRVQLVNTLVQFNNSTPVVSRVPVPREAPQQPNADGAPSPDRVSGVID